MSDDHLSTDMTTILMSWSLVENYYLNIVLRMWDHLLNKNTDWSHGGVFLLYKRKNCVFTKITVLDSDPDFLA